MPTTVRGEEVKPQRGLHDAPYQPRNIVLSTQDACMLV